MHFAAHLWMPFLDFVFMRRALIGGLVLAVLTLGGNMVSNVFCVMPDAPDEG